MKKLRIGLLVVVSVFALNILMTASASLVFVPPPLQPTIASNPFTNGATTIQDQATTSLPNGLPLFAVVRAEFNCRAFQVMCYTESLSSTTAFDSCINQRGTILKNATTVPGSTPNAICAAFKPNETMTNVGVLYAYYSQ